MDPITVAVALNLALGVIVLLVARRDYRQVHRSMQRIEAARKRIETAEKRIEAANRRRKAARAALARLYDPRSLTPGPPPP